MIPSGFPAAVVARRYIARSALLWVMTRALVSVMVMHFRGDLLAFPAVTGGIVLAIAAGLLEVHRRQEWVLVGNLGLPLPVLIGMLAVPAIAGEAVLQVAFGLVG